MSSKHVGGVAVPVLALSIVSGTCMAQVVVSGSGADAPSIQATVDAYRALLGDSNGGGPGSACEGRREINWDGAPDSLSAPNLFPPDGFNQPNAPLARGVEFTTPGTGFQLSAKLDSGVGIEYDNIDPTFSGLFTTFSAERLFTALDSTVTEVHFFVPGSKVPALSRGFGAVFTDVDVANSSSLEFFDAYGDSLGVWYVEDGPTEDESLSFLGVAFEEAIVSKVTIVSGNSTLSFGKVESYPAVDLVVLDDFIYAEPVSLCGADCDANGQLNILDFVCFHESYLAGSACADQNGDGELNILDFVYFQQGFLAGCD